MPDMSIPIGMPRSGRLQRVWLADIESLHSDLADLLIAGIDRGMKGLPGIIILLS